MALVNPAAFKDGFYYFSNHQTVSLVFCICMSILQSYNEIERFSKHQIYTATSIEQVDQAPITLVFCDTFPYNNQVS